MGQPGTALESFHLENELSLNTLGQLPESVVIASVLNPILRQNETYWVGASAGRLDADLLWARTYSDFGPIAYDLNFNGWVVEEILRGAFQVNGDIVSVSEPFTGPLILMSLTVLAVGKLRRKLKIRDSIT
jgi:hypothetical protein